ncbi:hypothetical protein [Bradyrhizobium sp. MOS002]|uniref:hypothetical protein n=1 Tax=Bradyrhizobium sp. MOS002 TaxID=2133947 RepID=UPI001304C451|nr:hypothetical protein [Bradyrhizobium sp. MOS002]
MLILTVVVVLIAALFCFAGIFAAFGGRDWNKHYCLQPGGDCDRAAFLALTMG